MQKLIDFGEVLRIYKKLFSVNDSSLIEILMAHYLSHKLEKRDPVWLFVVAPSSFGKTLHLKGFEDFEDVYLLTKLTSRTLITGLKSETDEVLKMDGKIVLIPDFSQFLTLNPQEKSEIWSQFRNLWDGYAIQKFGSGKRVEYRNLFVSLLTCSTPDIENQITLFQTLGTRHISFRVDYWVEKNLDYLLEERETSYVVEQYKNLMKMFFEVNKFESVPKLDLETLKYLRDLTEFVSIFRSEIKVDAYSGEPIGFTSPEDPDRIFKMLKKMLKSYLMLSGDLERGKELIKRISYSCIEEKRYKIFRMFKTLCTKEGELDPSTELTINQIANSLKLGWKTVKSELYCLAQLGLLDFYEADSEKRLLKWFLTKKGEKWLNWF
ncbi:hypothetical protein J7J18_04635 [bacterium]|nr:hypothetical protein [bacterium]